MTRVRSAATFLALLALIVLGQWCGGAFQAEFIEDGDESGHYVTGLMMHDYVASGLPWPPMKFAVEYNQRYPRVALGHWPPFFYMVQSAWMFVFQEGRASVLLLIASIAALWAMLSLRLFQRYLGTVEGWFAVLFLIATPEALLSSRMVMTDILIALLMLAAVWALHKLFEEPGWRWSLAFGALATAAMMTKGTGILLAPLPILAVLTLRRWDLLKSPWFWLPAVMVVAVCLPWYLLAPYALHEKAARFGGPHLRTFRIAEYWEDLALQLSWPGLLLAMGGWTVAALRIARRTDRTPFWALAVWIIPVAWAFRVEIGAWHARHLITLAPFLLLLAGIALKSLLTAFPRQKTMLVAAAAALALIVTGQHLSAMGRKPHRGLDLVAREILRRPELAGKTLIVVSNSAGEGAFVAEMAMREKRPGHVVMRGYKVLTDYTTIGQQVSPRFHNSAETMSVLAKLPGVVLIFDPASLHDFNGQLIDQMLKQYPGRWREAFVQALPGSTRSPIRTYLPVAVLGQ